MKKIFIALLLCSTVQATIPAALEQLKNDLSQANYARIAQQCEYIQAAIALAPDHLHRELTTQLEKRLRTTHRTDNSVERALRTFTQETLAPSVGAYREQEEHNAVTDRHLQPVYRTLGVLACCAALYLLVSYLRNHRAKRELLGKDHVRHLPHDQAMVTGLRLLVKKAGGA